VELGSIDRNILRVLQEGEIQRVGGTQTIKVNVRLVAATNKNLEQMVKESTFREDLYYRLNVFRIRLPSLRERKEDIPLISNFLLQKLSIKTGGKAKRLSRDAMQMLISYNWPGNVRELENSIQHSAVISQGELILKNDLPEELRKASVSISEPPADPSAETETSARFSVSEVGRDDSASLTVPSTQASESSEPQWIQGSIDRDTAFDEVYKILRKENSRAFLMAMEKEMIIRALKETKGNQLKASDLLGISRSTLRKRIEEFSLDAKR